MFHKRQQRLGFFAATIASAAIVVPTAGLPAIAAEGPNQVKSCQLGPNGENPCPDAGPDQQKTEAELCTLGYGPNGKLQCVDDDGAPDDLKSCEPEPQNPDVDPCNHGGGGGGQNKHKPQIYTDSDEPDSKGNEKSLKLAGGIPVPTRIDTGAGGTAPASRWPLLLVPAVILIATAIRTATVSPDLVSGKQDR